MLMKENCIERMALDGEKWRKALLWGQAAVGLGEDKVCFSSQRVSSPLAQAPQSQMTGLDPNQQSKFVSSQHSKGGEQIVFLSSELALELVEDVSGEGSSGTSLSFPFFEGEVRRALFLIGS